MLDGKLLLRAVVDIAVVSYVIYRLILLAKGRRAWWILIGLGVFFLLLLASDYLELVTLNWLLRQVTPLGPIAIVVLFFPELREVLEKLGRAEFWGTPIHVGQNQNEMTPAVIEEVVKAAGLLAPLKTGALIVLERETGLDDVINTGTVIDSEVSAPLLTTIFHHGTPLHDGAVIIRNGRIAAAQCTLPLSDAANIPANVHMRHRAAMGVSSTSDAVVVVVSEETGTISIAIDGKLQRGLKPEALRTKLLESFGRLPKPKSSSVSLPFVRRRPEEKA
jgi:diadenylate cyclase